VRKRQQARTDYLGIVESVFGQDLGYEDSFESRRALTNLLGTLTAAEQMALTLRNVCGLTLRQCSEVMGYPYSERLRQIEAKAYRKLRHPTRSKHLKPYLDLK